jgi:signal transduction histidine kinase
VLILWGTAILLRAALRHDPLKIPVAIGDSWSRYLLCFPGSVLAFTGLLRQARQVRELGLPQIGRYLTGAAVAFLAYAVVAGLIVPTAPVFPANLVNYSLLAGTVNIPVPVIRSLCGLAMAFFVVRSLEVFQAEADRRMAAMEQAQVLAADRERIGRDLHDGIIQNIYAAGLSLERMQRQMAGEADRTQRIQSVLEILNRTILDIRRYIFDLRSEKQTRELETVLEDLVRDLRLDTRLQVDLRIQGERCEQMTPAQVSHLTQIAREALSNVVQHSQARRVAVNLDYAPGEVRLLVVDDGQGVPSEVLSDGYVEGRGISNMRERTHQMGGNFSLKSKPGHGTQLTVNARCADSRTRAQ